jgi:hypothetical protein
VSRLPRRGESKDEAEDHIEEGDGDLVVLTLSQDLHVRAAG